MADDFILPPALEEGDKIAVIRTGNGPGKTEFHEVYDLGLERLENVFGLEPVEFPTCEMNSEELTSNPEKRAEDIMTAFKRDDIKGIIAVIGGSGEQVRILKHLDPEVLKENPTRLYGYSDNTSLINYLWDLGIISFYGPMIMTQLAMQGDMHQYSIENIRKVFFEETIGSIQPAEKFTDEDLSWAEPENLHKTRELEENPGWEWHNCNNENIEGCLWGGCLEVLSINLGAERYIPDNKKLEGAILAVETSEEMPGALQIADFMIAMGERGLLEKFSALIVGRPKARNHSTEIDTEQREKYRERQKQEIKKWMNIYAPETPIIFNFDFGHTDPIIPMPMGGKIHIDCEQKEVKLE